MAEPLAPDTPPDRALRQIVAECHADLLKYRAVVLASRRPIGIHQTRVALRRLRAALGLFRDAVGPVEAGWCGRWRPRPSGWPANARPARDLHVFLTETVEDVPPVVKRIAARLARTHLERARAALSGARYNAFDGQLDRLRRGRAAAGQTGRLDEFGRDRARAAPRQGRAARPAPVESLDRKAPAPAAHRHQEAALCRRPSCGRPLRSPRRRRPISRRQCACRARSAP